MTLFTFPVLASILEALSGFLFGSIFGWWILLVMAVVLIQPLIPRFRAWKKKRAFILSEGTKLQNPQNAEARFRLAAIDFEGLRFTRAEKRVREAVRIAEESPLYDEGVPCRFWTLLGDLLARRRRYPDAVEAYKKALKAKNELGHGEVLLGLGRCTLRMGALEEALEWLDRSRKERSSTLETYFRMAQVAARMDRPGDLIAARKLFRETAASLPAFARKGRFRWRLLFLLFPLTRHMI